jgi:hypothetical protein
VRPILAQWLVLALARQPASWIVAAAILLLAAVSAFLSPVGIASTGAVGWMPELVLGGALAGAALVGERLEAGAWPLVGLDRRSRLVTQAAGLFTGVGLFSAFGLLGGMLVGIRFPSKAFLIGPLLACAHVICLAWLLLQIPAAAGVRSLALVLLAWAVPAFFSPSSWFGAGIHATLGASRDLIMAPWSTTGALARALPPIIVLASAAVLAGAARGRGA